MSTVIIGGGAAGCFAAVFSARQGDKVILVEPNGRLGRKLSITGKGRCNITNNCDFDTLMKNVYRNPSFLYSAFSRFGTADCMEFIVGLGVPLKTERGNRVFPVSDRAGDIVSALEKEIKGLGVETVWERALDIVTDNGRVSGVKTDKRLIPAEKVILATGGVSYRATGSTGDGYRMAERLGHTVTELKPSLIPLETEESGCRTNRSSAAGLTVKNAVLTLLDTKSGKKLFSDLGELTFEEYGVGGPLVLSASAMLPMTRIEQGRYLINIDFKPALDNKKLDLRLQREIAADGKADLYRIMRTLLPEKLIAPVLKQANADSAKKAAEISSALRKSLVSSLKSYTLTVKAFRPINEAIITDGGISTAEINPSDMQSKLVKGLHFAGEIIDVSGFTGGFNLQIAYSTAKAAARKKG